MPTYLFISGKNWILSLAELTAYFNARNNKFEVQYFSREFFVINLEKNIPPSAMADLGGTIKIGQPKTTVPTQIVKEAFLNKNKQTQKQIIKTIATSNIPADMTPKKFLFGVSVYFTDNTFSPVSGRMQRFIGSAVKEELSGLGKKANFMGYSVERSAFLYR
jgi:hypothetical protein